LYVCRIKNQTIGLNSKVKLFEIYLRAYFYVGILVNPVEELGGPGVNGRLPVPASPNAHVSPRQETVDADEGRKSVGLEPRQRTPFVEFAGRRNPGLHVVQTEVRVFHEKRALQPAAIDVVDDRSLAENQHLRVWIRICLKKNETKFT